MLRHQLVAKHTCIFAGCVLRDSKISWSSVDKALSDNTGIVRRTSTSTSSCCIVVSYSYFKDFEERTPGCSYEIRTSINAKYPLSYGYEFQHLTDQHAIAVAIAGCNRSISLLVSHISCISDQICTNMLR
eukprot:scaffold382749_cov35-Prasinocladus_malaysianus.AAC.1